MAVITYKKGVKALLSQNFTIAELSCKGKGCCDGTKIDDKLVELLQRIRDRFGALITVTSGYRCTTHNKNVGGTVGSYHTKGQAADIIVKGVSPKEVACYAESIGILGIGLYEDFVHIDTRTSKAFWYGHSQSPRSTFGGTQKDTVSVLEFQKAAISDGYKFPKYGADGVWGSECEAVAKKAVCKKRVLGYKNKNLTQIIQAKVCTAVDGRFGVNTEKAVMAFQKNHGLCADGVVGIKTWRKILGI